MEHPGVVSEGVLVKMSDSIPDNACTNYGRCGNVVPHNGQMCSECLDRARKEANPDEVS